VVGDDGRHDVAQRRTDAAAFRARQPQEQGRRRAAGADRHFATGYLLACGAFSVLATALQWGMGSARLLSPMLETNNRWLGATLLLAARLGQLTPLKAACLQQCRPRWVS
jgi:predicted metal-binding membrane protein